LFSCSGNDTKYTRSLWRRFVASRCKRQANDHKRWRDCYEGEPISKPRLPKSKADLIKLLDIVHPAARILTDIARSQDAEVGDGTTSVVVLAGEILKEVKDHVEQGVSSQTIIKGLRRASTMAVNKVKEIAVNTSEGNKRETLSKLAGTAMSSKLIKRNTGFFTKSMF
jgi:chaperonin GroEL (HSP60 family)